MKALLFPSPFFFNISATSLKSLLFPVSRVSNTDISLVWVLRVRAIVISIVLFTLHVLSTLPVVQVKILNTSLTRLYMTPMIQSHFTSHNGFIYFSVKYSIWKSVQLKS